MKKVVIIGAGPAGLTAAYELLKNKNNNYKVIIVEEDKQVGGISKTINYKGNKMDVGGHRFFTKEKRVQDLWFEFLPLQGKNSYDDKKLKNKKILNPSGPNPEKENKVMLLRNRVSRIYYNNKFFDYPISLNMKTIRKMGFINTFLCGISYLKVKVFKIKEKNLEDFYINSFGKRLYSMFFRGYTNKVWGKYPKDISKEWGEQRVKGLSIIGVIKDYLYKVFNIKNTKKETSLIDEFYYPKFGPGQLYEEMEKKVQSLGGEVIKSAKVIKFHKYNNNIDKVVYEKNNKKTELKADIVISSMPIKDLLNDMNNVPKKILKISNDLPYRDFITIGALVDKLNLKNETKIKTLNNIIPDCWLYIQDDSVKMGRIQIFNNWSPYLVKDINHRVWIGLEYFCNENDWFWNMSDKEIIKYAEDELRKIKVINSEFIDSTIYRMKKTYPAYFGSYSQFDNVKEYLNSIDNLYCIGRNGQHHYNNMDHSIMTGIKVAEFLLYNKGTKEDIWNVNTEQEYHEVKSNEDNKENNQ